MSFLNKIVNYLRELMGEGAYARHCEYLRRIGRSAAIPTPQRFYLDSLEKKYSTPSRCC